MAEQPDKTALPDGVFYIRQRCGCVFKVWKSRKAQVWYGIRIQACCETCVWWAQ